MIKKGNWLRFTLANYSHDDDGEVIKKLTDEVREGKVLFACVDTLIVEVEGVLAPFYVEVEDVVEVVK